MRGGQALGAPGEDPGARNPLLGDILVIVAQARAVWLAAPALHSACPLGPHTPAMLWVVCLWLSCR